MTAGAGLGPSVDLLVLGGQKCGTTSLWRVLRQQPWFLPGSAKELHHFNANRPAPDHTYRASFPTDAAPGQLRGEATPNYLSSHVAPARIRAHNPDVALIVVLRDPVERAISAFRHARRLGAIGRRTSLETVFFDEARRHAIGRPWAGIRWDGLYARHIDRYLQLFAPQQLHVMFFEDLVADPAATLEGLWSFLGKEGRLPPHLPHVNRGREPRLATLGAAAHLLERRLRRSGHAHAARILQRARCVTDRRPSAPPVIDPVLRERMQDEYAPDIARLTEIVGRRPPWPSAAHASHGGPVPVDAADPAPVPPVGVGASG